MWLKPALMLDFSISVEARTRSLAVGQTTIAGLQENLGGAFAAAAESTALHGAALMTGGNNCSYFLSSYFYAYCCRRNSWGFIKILICRKATT